MRDHYVHVIDDDEDTRASIGFVLATMGVGCLEYRSGNEFLARAGSRPPGCILLDLRMPGMNGLDVQKALVRRGIHWPILFMSGEPTTETVVEAVRSGAVEFIAKPFEEEELLTALHHGFIALDRLDEPARHASARR